MGLFDRFRKKDREKPQDNPLAGIKLPDNVVLALNKDTKNMSPVDLRKTAVLHYQLADSYSEKGDLTHARNYYLHAVENIKALAEKGKDPGDLQLLYRCYAYLGVNFRSAGDLAQAAQYWEKAFQTERLLIGVDSSDTGHYSAAGISSQWAAFCYRESGQKQKAARCYQDGLEIIRKAEESFGRVFVHGDAEGRTFDSFRAEACMNLANMNESDPKKALEMAKECITSLTQLYTLDDSSSRLYDLANGLYLCGRCLKGEDRQIYLKHANSLCEEAMKTDANRLKFAKLQKQIKSAL